MVTKRIVFIPATECGIFTVPGFSLDPVIPLPVELDEDASLADLSLEMILSGMLRVIAKEPGTLESEYYRNFLRAARPGLLEELGGAALFKARNGDPQLAREIIGLLQVSFPDSPEFLLYKALVCEETGSDATDAYRQALAHDSPVDDAFFYAGRFFMKNRNFTKASDYFRLYLSFHIESEKNIQAEQYLKEIDHADLMDRHFQEAYQQVIAGDEDKALESIRIFLQQHPAVWHGWFLLGWALRRLGRFEDGRAAFAAALEYGGDTADTHNELAICCMEIGDYARARTELEKALRHDAENIKIISNMGVLALKIKKYAEAESFFRIVLELDPEDPVANEYIQKMEQDDLD
ncbi:hypothetical protein FACS1894164_06360 [Spirochaetia bacterium]|nr:hypothetical protein FACS1894164_06360 [Spirochaetia bacterium]